MHYHSVKKANYTLYPLHLPIPVVGIGRVGYMLSSSSNDYVSTYLSVCCPL
nr:MAG TPA: Protein of unknown function (DUF2584) [Bacteriophage sp.]